MDDPGTRSPTFLTAKQAAELLDISVPTLYAYVSRGLLHSEPTASTSRARQYRRDEVELLVARREQRRDPAKVAAGALDFGVPVLESAITLISEGRYFYRGHDAVELAKTRTQEEVAHLIWLGDLPRGPSELFADAAVRLPAGYRKLAARDDLEPIERLQLLLPVAAVDDLQSHDSRPRATARCAARILRPMAVAASGTAGRDTAGLSVARILQRAWCAGKDAREHVDDVVKLFDAALVLTADHELNVSSFTARCVASAGATPYEVVTAGLAALRGKRHGGLSTRTETLLAQLWLDTGGEPERIDRALVRRLKQGDSVPGFGHRLYPDGDPRGRALLDLAGGLFPDSQRGRWTRHVVDVVDKLLGECSTVDFALAAVSLVLGLPSGAALALFALGRTVGWIGQAIEQEEAGQLIRPRARYTGPLPEESP